MLKKIHHFVYKLYKILVTLFLNFFRQFIYSFSQQKIPNMGTGKRIKQPSSGKAVLSINKASSESYRNFSYKH